jgi:isopentenyl-diphosphate Delta-isomerase
LEDQVILVDSNDNAFGVEGKMAVHRSAKLHRAISGFVFDSRGRLRLQRRASRKYHSGGLWSNACCSHPRPKELRANAARRRLGEEMGIDCELEQIFSFTYRAQLGNQFIEHEYDHVFLGTYDGDPTPNPEEAEGWKWIELGHLYRDMTRNPSRYSVWSVTCIERVRTLATGGLARGRFRS